MRQDCCFICHEKRLSCDDDPNGDYPGKCARCTAEEEHDFDAEPDVEFDRYGNKTIKVQLSPLLFDEPHKECAVEIERLRDLVMDAYLEGIIDGKRTSTYSVTDHDLWNMSNAKKELDNTIFNVEEPKPMEDSNGSI